MGQTLSEPVVDKVRPFNAVPRPRTGFLRSLSPSNGAAQNLAGRANFLEGRPC